MSEFQAFRGEAPSHSNKVTIPYDQTEAPDRSSNAGFSTDFRRRTRAGFTSYITGQRSKPGPVASNNRKSIASSAFSSYPSWHSFAFDQDFPPPAAPPETKQLLESIARHVLTNPLQPLPVHFNSAFSYIAEAFQKLEDDLAQVGDSLNEEVADRQSSGEARHARREVLERDIGWLDDSLHPKREFASRSKTTSKKHENNEVTDELQATLPGMTQTATPLTRVLDHRAYVITKSRVIDTFAPFEFTSPTLHGSRSAFELRGNTFQSGSHNSPNLAAPTTENDTRNVQTIASIVARRQAIPIADVWNEAAYLYFDRFKAGTKDNKVTQLETLRKNKPSEDLTKACENRNSTMGLGADSENHRSPPTITPSNHRLTRDFSFNIGDDNATQGRSLTLPTESFSNQLPRESFSSSRDDLLHSTYSPQKSRERSTTPESDRRAWDWWNKSRIPSPVQESSYLARPRRESSASSMLTAINVGREHQKRTSSDVPRLAFTPVDYVKDDQDCGLDGGLAHKRESASVRMLVSEKGAHKKLVHMKSADSLRKTGEGRLTTSTLARKMKYIGSSPKDLTK
ncbi:MAG: hypothetical protein M1821_004165 [Bathelium mastoideum]|nr:MAG: hypothetical protein M1821_004165 [Bathelium mastoideum]